MVDAINKIIKSIKNFLHIFLFYDLFKGLKITFNNLFSYKNTIRYPEEKTPQSFRFRGLHALRRYQNGKERCIGCKLCESACPSLAITIETQPRSDGSRHTTKYEIDLFKCVFCGLCEEACPVDAIVETRIFEYHFEKRGQNILTKSKLLAIGDKYEIEIAKDRSVDKICR